MTDSATSLAGRSNSAAVSSQAWEELSGPSSSSPSQDSASGEDIIKVNHPARKSDSQPQNTPPPAPPSLTLSIFTMPGHLSAGRIAAVLGINLVLPFINGVMLGFGEIFAREAFKVGRLWYREGGNLWHTMFGRRDDPRGGARGVGSVGLSGSGGFP
jgi:hypothetical protein